MISRRSVLLRVPAVAAVTLAAPTLLATTASAQLPQQSPVALDLGTAVRMPNLPELVVDYPDEVDLEVRYVSRDASDPTGCSTRGREETIEAEVPAGAAAVELGGTRYELLQFHFHTPSEHTLGGRRFPVEQHFVHRGPAGQLLVVGLFLLRGGPGRAPQDRVLAALPQECGENVEVGGVDLADALPRRLSTFRYSGSLTTGPFTEGVSWLVLQQPRQVATSTIESFQQTFPEGDARETQPLNGRTVGFRRQP